MAKKENQQTSTVELKKMKTEQLKTHAKVCGDQMRKAKQNQTKWFFKLCLALEECSTRIPYGGHKKWYKSVHLSERQVQKRVNVAKRLKGQKSVHVNGFTPSQLIRIAALENSFARNHIIKNKIDLPSKIFEALATSQNLILIKDSKSFNTAIGVLSKDSRSPYQGDRSGSKSKSGKRTAKQPDPLSTMRLLKNNLIHAKTTFSPQGVKLIQAGAKNRTAYIEQIKALSSELKKVLNQLNKAKKSLESKKGN